MPIMESKPGSGARIALFRARDDAAESAARLRALQYSVACLPVIEIAPIPFAPSKTRYDAVVATSAKAFLADAPVDRASPLYVVGAQTARAAEARGWRLAAPPAPEAPQLIEALQSRLAPGASVLYLAGRDRKEALETTLAGSCALEVVETYRAEARQAWRPDEIEALASSIAALHYSRRSASLAARLAESAGVAAYFLSLRHLCLSQDAAGPLVAIEAAHVFVADKPDEESLFAALGHAMRVFPSDGRSRI
jgi:uroporphyrinogen-III synthase